MSPALVSQAALTETITEKLRNRIIEGQLLPGQRLAEAALATELEISRNTLREAFRILTRDGLLRYELNRGVFVASPSMGTILDVFRIRRMIEVPALTGAHPSLPGVALMRAAYEAGQRAAALGDWRGTGSANIEFHAAIVSLASSPRLDDFFQRIAAELRLAFGLMQSPEHLHGPYVAQNLTILELTERGQAAEAAQMLESYLEASERNVLRTFSSLQNQS